jgi:hypothetical protein
MILFQFQQAEKRYPSGSREVVDWTHAIAYGSTHGVFLWSIAAPPILFDTPLAPFSVYIVHILYKEKGSMETHAAEARNIFHQLHRLSVCVHPVGT